MERQWFNNSSQTESVTVNCSKYLKPYKWFISCHIYFVGKYDIIKIWNIVRISFLIFYNQINCYYIKFITSWTSRFNEAMFREIRLPSSGNVNDYVTLNRQVKIFLRKILLTSLLSLSLVNLVFIFNYFNIEIYELAVSCINSFYNKNMSYVCKKNLNPIQNGHFGGCSRMGGTKKPPTLKSVRHILQWWNLAQLCLT